ncbi:LicD family protein [Clostridium perfringens]
MENTYLKKIQKIELDILNEVVKVCEENNIRYQLCGGTLLGAIRHKGFIPWDDDIDIAMPRKDFDKFLNIAQEKLAKNIEVFSYKSNKVYPFIFAKVCNIETRVVENYLKSSGYEVGVFIDIFPMDGVPNNRFIREIHLKKINFYEKVLILSYLDEDYFEEKWKKIIIKIGHKLVNRNKIHQKIQNLLRKYSFENSRMITTDIGKKRKEKLMPREVFNDTEVIFENLEFKAPSGYEYYLECMYGDYMKIPPEDQRIQHGDYMKIEI